jgi:hypothetical protein
MATTKTVTKTTSSWSIANQETMGKEIGLAFTVGLTAGQTFDDLVAKAHKLSKGIIGTVRSKCPVMLAVNDVLKAYRKKDGKPLTPKSLKSNLSYIRAAIVQDKPVDRGNGGKVSTILIALGKKAEPTAMVESLLKGFNKMKLNSDNPFMQTLAMFLIDGVADAIKEAKIKVKI